MECVSHLSSLSKTDTDFNGTSQQKQKSFYFLTKVLCSCHLYVLVVWRVFVFFPFQKILPFDMTLSLPLNNNMSHTEGILLFCGHHVKERISSNKKYIHFYDMKKRLINDVYLFYFSKNETFLFHKTWMFKLNIQNTFI